MASEPKSGLQKPVNGSSIRRMEQPIYDYVLSQLELSKGRWADIAEGSGVSKRTLEKIARREIEDPGVSHVQKLHDYFRLQNRKPS